MVTPVRTLTTTQADDLRTALLTAESRSDLRFAVFLGPPSGGRRHYAESLHAALGAESADAVLVYVDTSGRTMEIVTGENARLLLPDGACRMVAMSMATAFSVGDYIGGLLYGVSALADRVQR